MRAFKILGKGKRGWLRPIVISMLRYSPKNGMEIMDAVEKMSLGIWRPSPGSLYPVLDELAKERIIKKNKDGKYELTENGKKIVYPWEEKYYMNEHDLEDVLNEIDGYVSYLEDLKTGNKEEIAKRKRRLQEIGARIEKLLK